MVMGNLWLVLTKGSHTCKQPPQEDSTCQDHSELLLLSSPSYTLRGTQGAS